MIDAQEQVILVDDHDREIGLMDKMEAHRKGLLHRAFSIFLFNTDGDLLIQQRALNKYHSGGLWTNACCSHPRAAETIEQAACRRLMEEMGMRAEMKRAFHFMYRAELDHELIEHELDHVLIGVTDSLPEPDPKEVAGFRYVSIDLLQSEMAEAPEQFTAWFLICLPEVLKHIGKT